MPFVCNIRFKCGLYLVCTHVDELKHNCFILSSVHLVKQLLERPIQLLEQLNLYLFSLSDSALLLFQRTYEKSTKLKIKLH